MDTLATLAETANIAETLARELKNATALRANADNDHLIFGLPPGWKTENVDLEKLRDTPRRKVAKVNLTDTDSTISYLKRHGSLANATVWCQCDYTAYHLSFIGILNDHGEKENEPHWRDHRALYTPEKSEEYKRWTQVNKKAMSQEAFAVFLEDNLKDITTADGFPTGAQMLQMALDFQAKQDMRFKSAIRIQSGGVRMEYVADEDKNTIEAMQIFDRFQIAIPVFRNDVARYPIEARLRYRVKEGALVFWFELIRPDLVIEQSANHMIEKIRAEAGLPFFFGSPEP